MGGAPNYGGTGRLRVQQQAVEPSFKRLAQPVPAPPAARGTACDRLHVRTPIAHTHARTLAHITPHHIIPLIHADTDAHICTDAHTRIHRRTRILAHIANVDSVPGDSFYRCTHATTLHSASGSNPCLKSEHHLLCLCCVYVHMLPVEGMLHSSTLLNVLRYPKDWYPMFRAQCCCTLAYPKD